MIILLIIVCIIVLEEIAELFFKKTKAYKSSLGGADRLHKVPDGIDICNIGSGPGLYAISYDYCEKNGFNFSTAPQNYKYGFRLLKKFSNKIKENAIIIIIIMCPLSFGKNNEYERRSYSDKFYGILPKEDIDNYSLKRLFIINHPLAFKFLRKVFSIIKPKSHKKMNTENDKSSVIDIWKQEFNLSDLLNPEQGKAHQKSYEEKIQILQEGLNYCYSKNWKPVFVTPPIPQKTRECIGDDFLTEFVYQNIDKLLEKNKDLRYLNFFDEKLPDEYFENDTFMNKEGQKYFSEKLFNNLRGV